MQNRTKIHQNHKNGVVFNARQLSRCPELPAGNGNYACWQKSAAASSEQWRNPCLQDGKALEGLQARPDPVYEPTSVSLIFRLGQKESPLDSAAGIQRDSDSIDLLMCSSQISRRILRLALTSKLYLGTVVCCDSHYFIDIRLRFIVRFRIASALPS